MKKLDDIHFKIQKGDGIAALELLETIKPSKLERKLLPFYAQCAWRLNEPHLGLRALAKFVRPDLRALDEPTTAEMAEYAACLHRAGASREAEQLLSQCDATAYPRTLFYKAAILVSQWDYDRALPLLEQFARSEGISAYELLVTKINIAEALVVKKENARAHYLLSRLLYDSSLNQYRFAMAKVLEIAGQNAVQSRKWSDARQMFERAFELCQRSNTVDPLIARKFKLFLEMSESAEDFEPQNVSVLLQDAFQTKHWETVRDTERQFALFRKSEEDFRQVYFGTPHKAFRDRLLKEWPEADVTGSFRWKLGGSSPNAEELSLVAGETLYEGKLIQKVILALSKDFYRPKKTAALYSEIYPNEVFRYESSPQKVRQIVLRTRQWLKQHFPSLDIERKNDGFRLEAKAPVVIVCPADDNPDVNPNDLRRLNQLKSNFSDSPFSLKQAGKLLDLSTRSVLRILTTALQQGTVARNGAGRSTQYSFTQAE